MSAAPFGRVPAPTAPSYSSTTSAPPAQLSAPALQSFAAPALIAWPPSLSREPSIIRARMFRAFFIWLSESKALRSFAEKSRVGRRLSRRFVAGMSVDEVLQATAQTNALGMAVSVDNLGENVTNLEEASHSARLYNELIDEISTRRLEANVSLKLTHMGLDVDEALAREITGELVAHAERRGNFVRVDMEGSAYTQKTLDLVHELHRIPANQGRIGAVIQAYLHRS